jgi:hypothetical protein
VLLGWPILNFVFFAKFRVGLSVLTRTNDHPGGDTWMQSGDGRSDMVILRPACPNRMVTKGYRKGVYKWVGDSGDLVVGPWGESDFAPFEALSSRAKHDLSEAKIVRSSPNSVIPSGA